MIIKKAVDLEMPHTIPLWFFMGCFIVSLSLGLQKDGYRWDAGGYYAYLPAIFLYQDLNFDFIQEATIYPKSEFISKKTGINKYALGVAILQFPFYGLACLFNVVSGKENGGYNRSFKFAVSFGALFYASLGLYFLALCLRLYFNSFTSNLTVIAIGLGTNLVYYSIVDYMLSHVYSFFLFSAALWFGILWNKANRNRDLILIFFITGLIAATRLTNVVFILVPLLWNVESFQDIKLRFNKVLKEWRIFPILIAVFILPLLPQLFYVFSQMGGLLNPYEGEAFFWADPLIGKVLWSYRAGWLVWTPIMTFGFIGWIWARKQEGFLAILLFMLVNLYIISSWWCWWYGGSFGMRALVESSVPMAFGIAYFIDRIYPIVKKLLQVVIFILIGLNLFQSYQYRVNVIHFDAMSKKAYWTVFGKIGPLSPEIKKKKKEELEITNAKRAMTDPAYRRSL